MYRATNRLTIAVFLVLAAMALFGLIDNFVRLAAAEGGLWQFHFLRALLALATIVVIAKVARARLWPQRPFNVLARSFLISVSMVIYFGCLGFMPIAQVVAGLFTAPIFVVLFSVLFFGARVGPRRLLAVAIGFGGAVLALRPEASAITVWTVVPVIAGAFYGLGNIATRRWCEGEGTLTLLAGFFGCMFVWGALGVTFLSLYPLPVLPGADGFITRGWVPPQGIYLVMILVQGIGSLIGIGLITRAYQMAEASEVAVFENLLLVFATAWAAILWGEWPDTVGLAGLALILLAGMIIALRTDAPVSQRIPVDPAE